MRLILLTHPPTLRSASMPRFAKMIGEGMRNRGHHVEYWTSPGFFGKLPASAGVAKWLGYIDQFIVFPVILRVRILFQPKETLFVALDQALGMWIPHIRKRRHVVHVHDFMALKSALGEFIENPTGASGRTYQNLIRKGFIEADNFISVSRNTQQDLQRFLEGKKARLKVVYNSINPLFVLPTRKHRDPIFDQLKIPDSTGYLLHVGGNQWYKNRIGVVQIYTAWRQGHGKRMPLLLVGASPSGSLQKAIEACPYKEDIFVVTGTTDAQLLNIYQGAEVLLFPSLAEGFGWPIAEAMASGCPVITTDEAPMTEVGGDAAIYIARKPPAAAAAADWACEAARVLDVLLELPQPEKEALLSKCQDNAERFRRGESLKEIEDLYQEVVNAGR